MNLPNTEILQNKPKSNEFGRNEIEDQECNNEFGRNEIEVQECNIDELIKDANIAEVKRLSNVTDIANDIAGFESCMDNLAEMEKRLFIVAMNDTNIANDIALFPF